MAVKSVYNKYFQKSKVFLYPLLGFKRGIKVVPSETYLAWDPYYIPEDMKLVCLYHPKNTDDYESYEKKALLRHTRLCDVKTIDDNNKLFIFSSDSENVPNLAIGIKKSLEINDYLSIFNFKQLPSNPFVTYEIGDTCYETKLVGDYNFENIKFSIAISHYLDVELPTSSEAICSYSPVNNRSQFIKKSNNEVILDAYNANPSSVENALNSFFNVKSDFPKIAILGDMLELGDISKEEHLNVLNKLNNQNDVKPLFVGSIYFQFSDKFDFTFFENTEEASRYFEKNAIKKALVLFKGSRGIALEKLLEKF